MSDVALGLRDVRQRLAAACEKAGRPADAVGLIAVGKRHPASRLAMAYDVGQRDFGENFAQEMRDKQTQLSSQMRWHFIGRVQRNKAKWIAARAHRVHAVESLRQGVALAKHAPQPLGCLLAVNIAAEPSKSGVRPDQVLAVAKDLSTVSNLSLVGLMCLPPRVEDPSEVAPWFEQMADLAARGRAAGLPLHELSMGMSGDFEVAVQHGATWVRVGTAIFGARD